MKINLNKEELNLEALKLSQAEIIAHSPEELQKLMDAMYANVFSIIVKLQQDYTTKLNFVVEQVNAHLEAEIKKANAEHNVNASTSLTSVQDTLKTLKIDVK